MTISDKIRVYELSRDLNLENKDILDAAQKLSISVKSHSSSISLADAKKIKNLITPKNKGEKIISVSKPSLSEKTDTSKNRKPQNKYSSSNLINKDNSNNKPTLIRPINKQENINTPRSASIRQSPKFAEGNKSSNLHQEKKPLRNPINTPTRIFFTSYTFIF